MAGIESFGMNKLSDKCPICQMTITAENVSEVVSANIPHNECADALKQVCDAPDTDAELATMSKAIDALRAKHLARVFSRAKVIADKKLKDALTGGNS